MRLSKMFMPTLREVPAEAEIISHQLMLRAGLMRKLASGIYSFLPLGYKVFRKIEEIVRDEMDKTGAQELLMSALLPSESYQESGRWEVFGPEMFKLQDRNSRDFCLGPTHEEIFTDTVKAYIKSYKSLPINLYQIQTKYRDERRPRFGVMRSREFVMKDAYSFDKDISGLDLSYEKMYSAYCRIFERLNLDYTIVEADSGAMGGSGSQEFMVKSEIGEDALAYCNKCGYAANNEKAVCSSNNLEIDLSKTQNLEEVYTPNIKTIDDLISFFNCEASNFAKTLVYKADDEIIAVLVRGDRELNETKLKNYLNCIVLEMASSEDIEKVTNAEVGFTGPINIKSRILVDNEITKSLNLIVGANKTGFHYKNTNFNIDFKSDEVLDLRTIEQGDSCPICGAEINIARGIEVGHIFKLGTKYSEALNCSFLDENGKSKPMVMGSYGIGINRSMAAIIEQNNDKNGIIWPLSVAPYHAVVIPIKSDDAPQMDLAEEIYNKLLESGIEVLLDDRKERPGVKFKDADLIGIPFRINVGRLASENIVEYKPRQSENAIEITSDEAINKIIMAIKEI